ncbi:MAG: hypothetical protein KatS3mg001_088 [Candidatus Pacearchaeota archaeon]|nr:MAG: hypothetical protein KatS3mg001_088 [Candidatus Pacearchaeota archaeon]
MTEFIVTLIVLAFLGIIDSIFLIYKNTKKEAVVCPVGEPEGCSAVLESKYSKIFFVKNEILGLLYYVFVFLLGIFLYFKFSSIFSFSIERILFFISLIALIFSSFLFYIQVKKIKKYCFYCIISALISLLIFLNVLIL